MQPSRKLDDSKQDEQPVELFAPLEWRRKLAEARTEAEQIHQLVYFPTGASASAPIGADGLPEPPGVA
jgi:hypothetical protein